MRLNFFTLLRHASSALCRRSFEARKETWSVCMSARLLMYVCRYACICIIYLLCICFYFKYFPFALTHCPLMFVAGGYAYLPYLRRANTLHATNAPYNYCKAACLFLGMLDCVYMLGWINCVIKAEFSFPNTFYTSFAPRFPNPPLAVFTDDAVKQRLFGLVKD